MCCHWQCLSRFLCGAEVTYSTKSNYAPGSLAQPRGFPHQVPDHDVIANPASVLLPPTPLLTTDPVHLNLSPYIHCRPLFSPQLQFLTLHKHARQSSSPPLSEHHPHRTRIPTRRRRPLATPAAINRRPTTRKPPSALSIPWLAEDQKRKYRKLIKSHSLLCTGPEWHTFNLRRSEI